VNPISRRIVGFGFLTSLASIALPALAATTPPIKCRVLGETTTYKGKIYTCIKTRSKGKTVLAWDSGKAIPSAAATSSSTPTPTASPTQTAPTPVVVKKIEIPLANSTEVAMNSPKSFTAKNRFGFSTTYILVRAANGLIGLNAACTHSGCTVKLESEGFRCPCHNALFDSRSGDVLRGPATNPLDRLPVYEAEGVIYITD